MSLFSLSGRAASFRQFGFGKSHISWLSLFSGRSLKRSRNEIPENGFEGRLLRRRLPPAPRVKEAAGDHEVSVFQSCFIGTQVLEGHSCEKKEKKKDSCSFFRAALAAYGGSQARG